VRPELPAAGRRRSWWPEKYGAWQQRSLYGRKFMGVARTTYLIGRDGKVARRWDNVKVDKHVDEVLAAVEDL
jgi:peroxiredoxin Q/BCP